MNFFRNFTVKTTMLPLLAERLSCLYIQWFAYKYAICEVGLWKNCVFVSKFPVYRGELKVSETFLMQDKTRQDKTRQDMQLYYICT